VLFVPVSVNDMSLQYTNTRTMSSSVAGAL
jgi:hypothetical protein